MKTIDKVINDFEDLRADLQKKVAISATRASAKIIANEAKSRVPIRSGALRESIAVAKSNKFVKKGHVKFLVLPKRKLLTSASLRKSKANLTKRNIYTKVNRGKARAYIDPFYAHFVEFGTKKMRAKPYLKPAADAKLPDILNIFSSEVDKAIKRFSK